MSKTKEIKLKPFGWFAGKRCVKCKTYKQNKSLRQYWDSLEYLCVQCSGCNVWIGNEHTADYEPKPKTTPPPTTPKFYCGDKVTHDSCNGKHQTHGEIYNCYMDGMVDVKYTDGTIHKEHISELTHIPKHKPTSNHSWHHHNISDSSKHMLKTYGHPGIMSPSDDPNYQPLPWVLYRTMAKMIKDEYKVRREEKWKTGGNTDETHNEHIDLAAQAIGLSGFNVRKDVLSESEIKVR